MEYNPKELVATVTPEGEIALLPRETVSKQTRWGIMVIFKHGSKLLLQKRATDKKINPGKYSVITGHVSATEVTGNSNPLTDISIATAFREVQEETGWDTTDQLEDSFVSKTETNFISGESKPDQAGNLLLDVFIVTLDSEVNPESFPEDEVAGYTWANVSDIQSGRFDCTPEFAHVFGQHFTSE